MAYLFTEADSDMICQAGARWDDINITLAEKGIPLFFPVRLRSEIFWGIFRVFTFLHYSLTQELAPHLEA
jgi:hypothetical protein